VGPFSARISARQVGPNWTRITSHRLSEPSFYCWRRTLQQRGLIGEMPAEDATKSDTAAFVQVAIDSAAAAPRSIEIVLANGRRLRVRPGFDANTFRQLLRILEEPAC
jgi:hypothetical protein